ncbi:helix-turn-helix domain-containing protein [Streptomyces albidochromogenes]
MTDLSGPEDHPLVTAVKPLVDAMGGEMMVPEQARGDDVVLAWEGRDVVAVRLPQLSDSLDHILAALERRHGMPLAELDRKEKQSVVRILEARGAFSVRHGVETVASALGVSRFTVYNYLNRENAANAAKSD